jgi:hypothetical protein
LIEDRIRNLTLESQRVIALADSVSKTFPILTKEVAVKNETISNLTLETQQLQKELTECRLKCNSLEVESTKPRVDQVQYDDLQSQKRVVEDTVLILRRDIDVLQTSLSSKPPINVEEYDSFVADKRSAEDRNLLLSAEVTKLESSLLSKPPITKSDYESVVCSKRQLEDANLLLQNENASLNTSLSSKPPIDVQQYDSIITERQRLENEVLLLAQQNRNLQTDKDIVLAAQEQAKWEMQKFLVEVVRSANLRHVDELNELAKFYYVEQESRLKEKEQNLSSEYEEKFQGIRNGYLEELQLLNDALIKQQKEMSSQIGSLESEKSQMEHTRDGLEAEKEGWVEERNRLITDANGEKARMQASMHQLTKERDNLLRDNEVLRATKDKVSSENETLLRDECEWKRKHDVLVSERDASLLETGGVKADMVSKLSVMEKKLVELGSEKETWLKEREELVGSKVATECNLENALAEVVDLKQRTGDDRSYRQASPEIPFPPSLRRSTLSTQFVPETPSPQPETRQRSLTTPTLPSPFTSFPSTPTPAPLLPTKLPSSDVPSSLPTSPFNFPPSTPQVPLFPIFRLRSKSKLTPHLSTPSIPSEVPSTEFSKSSSFHSGLPSFSAAISTDFEESPHSALFSSTSESTPASSAHFSPSPASYVKSAQFPPSTSHPPFTLRSSSRFSQIGEIPARYDQKAKKMFIPEPNEEEIWEHKSRSAPLTFPDSATTVRPDVDEVASALLPPARLSNDPISSLPSSVNKLKRPLQEERALSTKRMCFRKPSLELEPATTRLERYIPHRLRRVRVRIGRIVHDAEYTDPEGNAKDDEFMRKYMVETSCSGKVSLLAIF